MSSEIISLNDLDLLSDDEDRLQEKGDIIDYKMVTFSLGGKDYGIDIMKIKEISKASKFTYVPNSIPFVRGVYNLRGDIISVIDMRLMFSLPVPENNGEPEHMIILRLEDNTIGVIVDTIDKVVGIYSGKIQPPHPLFGDINIKFIKGIVEKENKLYIILDVDSIFDQESAETALQQNSRAVPATPAAPSSAAPKISDLDDDEVDYSFIVDTLRTFRNFNVSPINERWVKSRFKTWSQQRLNSGLDVQLQHASDADEFLSNFQSPYSGKFWDKDYMEAFQGLLESTDGGTYNVWNTGCGKGEESYSAAVGLKNKFGNNKIKIYAQDSDLLNISTAPNLVFSRNGIPDLFDDYITEGRNGWNFISEIKDMILFEYHDINDHNQFPPVDMIIARDVLSYLSSSEQQKIIERFYDKLKTGGLLIIGANENISENGWQAFNKGRITAYKKI